MTEHVYLDSTVLLLADVAGMVAASLSGAANELELYR